MQIERRKRAGAGGEKEKACGGEAVGFGEFCMFWNLFFGVLVVGPLGG